MSCEICIGSGRESVCPVCSEEPETCPVCGEVIDPDASQCNNCGTDH
ncbi:zinc-ribbon domain-containing protein [Tenacibaculum sp.]